MYLITHYAIFQHTNTIKELQG